MKSLQRLTIAPAQLLDQSIMLTAEQHHYLRRVLRLQGGDRFIAMDGRGQGWVAQLEQDSSTAQILDEIAFSPSELPIPITLMMAIPKGTGMDDVVRQTTELGVNQIVPIISDRTLLHPSPQKLERWRRIAQEAAEQSERPIVPEIAEPRPFRDRLNDWNSDAIPRYLCAARGESPLLWHCLHIALASPASISRFVVAIGPEGGWTPDELAAAIAVGYQPVSLGQRILRAVTAPLAALSLMASAIDAAPKSIPVDRQRD